MLYQAAIDFENALGAVSSSGDMKKEGLKKWLTK